MKGHISRDTNMTGDTARHSSVLPKLENGLDRGAPGAKTKHSRIVPWHQGRAKAVYNRDSATDQLETLFGGLGVPPAAGGKHSPRTSSLPGFCENLMVFRGLPRACWEFFFDFFSTKRIVQNCSTILNRTHVRT